jgi:hypothetical protein
MPLYVYFAKDPIVITDLVDLVPFFSFHHNMQQSGIAASQYIAVFQHLI